MRAMPPARRGRSRVLAQGPASQASSDHPISTSGRYELAPGDELVDIAFVTNGDRLRLVRNGEDYVILLDDNELMSTDLFASEQALAEMTCERLGALPGVQLLIGGYGLGFTLRAALAVMADDGEITVAEIVPKILDWARGPMHLLTAGCLDDPRVQIIQEDVALLIDAAREGYDAILLDVDNGPEGLVRSANDWLYSTEGIAAARRALRPGGILAIWSATPDTEFSEQLIAAGFRVDVVTIPARHQDVPGNDSWEHVVIFAERGGD